MGLKIWVTKIRLYWEGKENILRQEIYRVFISQFLPKDEKRYRLSLEKF